MAIVCLIFLHHAKFIKCRSFILITAGALGNMYDRVLLGGVRDRIHISIFPVFNLADIMITIGVLLVALHYLRQSQIERAK
ncbi:signal peptidase II [Patescibacteria group bacterium]|nr:signal peptidase II [Patescibacteria group bacterium]